MCVGRGQRCVATQQTMWSIWGWITVQNMMELCSSRRRGVAKVRHNTFGIIKHHSWTGERKKRVATGNVYQCHGLWQRDSCLSALLFACWCSNYSSFPHSSNYGSPYEVSCRESYHVDICSVGLGFTCNGKKIIGITRIRTSLTRMSKCVCLCGFSIDLLQRQIVPESPRIKYLDFPLVVGRSIGP